MTNENIETIRNALKAKYEFPYYALIRVRPTHGPSFHIPAPFFDGSAGNLPIASDRRDGEYYTCPFCGEKSYYAGVCQNCRRDFEVWNEEEEEWEEGPLPIEYQNHEALKRAVKTDFLKRLDAGVPDLGIISAEIVLSNPPSNVCGENHSPFLKSTDWNAQRSLDHVERVIRAHESLKEKEEYQKMIREYTPADGVPLDYIEGDEIIVEGTDEKRRYQNDVWQHMHGDYCYWHPMGRMHKEHMMSVYPFHDPADEA